MDAEQQHRSPAACRAKNSSVNAARLLSDLPASQVRRVATVVFHKEGARSGVPCQAHKCSSGLADSYAAAGSLSYIAPGQAFLAAKLYATKALELDEALAEPHASLGFVKLYFE